MAQVPSSPEPSRLRSHRQRIIVYRRMHKEAGLPKRGIAVLIRNCNHQKPARYPPISDGKFIAEAVVSPPTGGIKSFMAWSSIAAEAGIGFQHRHNRLTGDSPEWGIRSSLPKPAGGKLCRINI